MKKYGLDLYLRRARIIWKKLLSKINEIKARLPAGMAQKKPPLSSLLATIGVNAENLINKFNEISKNLFTKDILLPTIITVSPTKTFSLNWKMPTVYDFYNETFNNLKKTVWEDSIKSLKKLVVFVYKTSIAKSTIKENYLNKIYKRMREIYGSLKSWDIYELADHEKDKKRFKKKKNG